MQSSFTRRGPQPPRHQLFGMMITDTLDGELICSIDRRTDGQPAARRYRRMLGWLIALRWCW